jgi:hypothetical protein
MKPDLEQKLKMVEANPTSLFGKEVGEAYNSDGTKFRLFFEEIMEAKSGKAVLGELTAVADLLNEKLPIYFNKVKEGEMKRYRWVAGVTYIPKFALDSPRWILDNKVHNSSHAGKHEMFIDNAYVPSEYKGGKYFNRDHSSEFSPEQKGENYVRDVRYAIENIKPTQAIEA